MKKSHRIASLLLAAAMTFAFVGCQQEITADNLTDNIESTNVPEKLSDDKFKKAYYNFSFMLLRSAYSDGENAVVSPLAAATTASMVANGSSGKASSEVQSMLGRNFPLSDLNVYLHTYVDRLEDTEQAKLYNETSLWFNKDKNCSPSDAFLSDAVTYYGVDAYTDSASSEVTNANAWISNKTGQKIEYIVNDINTDAPVNVMNVTTFEGDWAKPYSYDQVIDGKFTNSKGEEEKGSMMTSFEYTYLETESCTGFIKNYLGDNYALMVIMPNEGVPLISFIEFMSVNDGMSRIVSYKKDEVVTATLPKFECEYQGGLSKILAGSNVKNMFDSRNADLSLMGTCNENMYVGDIYSRTIMRATEKGTSKGTAASTGVNTDTASKTHIVTVDRPFIYMVVDTSNYLPIVLGAVNTVKQTNEK